jgi:hypothetical protein
VVQTLRPKGQSQAQKSTVPTFQQTLLYLYGLVHHHLPLFLPQSLSSPQRETVAKSSNMAMEDSIWFDGNAETPRHISWNLDNSGSTLDKESRSRTSRVSKQIVVVQVRTRAVDAKKD